MLMRAVMTCAMLVALAFAATPSHACEGLRCLFGKETTPPAETKSTSAPLKLNTFTRRKTKMARGTTAKRTDKSANSVTARRTAVKRANRKAPTRDTAHASAITVRVVASDELNEIDLRADAATGAMPNMPAAETALMAFAEEPIRPAQVSVINIDRKPKTSSPTRAISLSSESQQAAEPPPSPPDNWVIHAWTKLQTTLSNAVSAVRRLGD
jgi:hypothetical protein